MFILFKTVDWLPNFIFFGKITYKSNFCGGFMKLTYEKSGVDISVADAAKKEMAEFINNSNSRLLNKVGAFASLYDINDLGFKHPILVLKTEEPGSKQKLSIAHGKIKEICYDMINHLTNDILVMGATPLTVQDAIICGKLEKDVVSQLVKNISEACKYNGSVLTGGETSEQPNVVDAGTYILTSSIVGIVEKDQIIDGSKIACDDVVIALASNGIHTNGYSFLRALMHEQPNVLQEKIDGVSFMDCILTPHRSYFKELIGLFGNSSLSGLAHITGGGIAGNLNRILPNDLSAEIDISKIRVLPIFKLIKKLTSADDLELLKTFNMGVGMTIVVKNGSEGNFIKHFESFGLDSYVIGRIKKGDKTVNYINNLVY